MILRKLLRKALLFLCGILLLPFCAAATLAVIYLVRSIRPSSYSAIPSAAWALAIGFVLWVCIYLTMPRPVRTYVLAHELTHALWAYLTGVRVSRMKMSKSGGSVVLSENNILITLAPYFFPLYTVIAIVAYYVLSLFFDAGRYELFWLALIGFTWGFHVTFTISALLERQSDIREYGHVLSYAVIYVCNVFGVGLWIVAVSSATLERFVELLAGNTGAVWGNILKKGLILLQ